MRIVDNLDSYISLISRGEVSNLLNKCISMGMSAYPIIPEEFYILTHKSNIVRSPDGSRYFYATSEVERDSTILSADKAVKGLIKKYRTSHTECYTSQQRLKEAYPDVKSVINLTRQMITDIDKDVYMNITDVYKSTSHHIAHLNALTVDILNEFDAPRVKVNQKYSYNSNTDKDLPVIHTDGCLIYVVKDIDMSKCKLQFSKMTIFDAFIQNTKHLVNLMKNSNVVYFSEQTFITINGKTFELGYEPDDFTLYSYIPNEVRDTIYEDFLRKIPEPHIYYSLGKVYVHYSQVVMPFEIRIPLEDIGLFIGKSGSTAKQIANALNIKYVKITNNKGNK